jgi:hypothetical protein
MTEERITLTVGQPLDVKPQCEGYMPVLNGPSFDIIAFYSNLTQEKIDDWLQGKIMHGVVVERSIPIFVIDLGKSWRMDIYLNILLEDEELQRKFFEGDLDQATIHLTLVSYSDSIIQGIRTIAIEPDLMSQIKEACFRQISVYKSAEECQDVAEEMMAKWSSEDLRAMLRR